jgi:dUTPase
MKLTYEKIRDVKDPQFSNGNAGIDLFIPEVIKFTLFTDKHAYVPYEGRTTESIRLLPGDSIKIASGIKFDIPDGYALDFLNKSGVALNGLTIGSELIDSSYTGEVSFHLIAHRPFTIDPGLKIVQGVIIKDHVPDFTIVEGPVDKITDRGSGGFGSTGTK